MNNTFQSLQDGTFQNKWQKNFWQELHEGDTATSEFIVKYLDRPPVQCHSISGIISFIMDYPFHDTDDEITKALMRIELVKPLHRELTLQGIKSTITYGPAVLFDNTELPAYAASNEIEAAEQAETEWSDTPAVMWNLFNDRTLLSSLVQNKALVIMERSDVFVLRESEQFRSCTFGHCGTCHYYKTDESESFCSADLRPTTPDATVGRSCTNFAPVLAPEASPGEYVLIDAEMIYVPPFTVNTMVEDQDTSWIEQMKAYNRK